MLEINKGFHQKCLLNFFRMNHEFFINEPLTKKTRVVIEKIRNIFHLPILSITNDSIVIAYNEDAKREYYFIDNEGKAYYTIEVQLYKNPILKSIKKIKIEYERYNIEEKHLEELWGGIFNSLDESEEYNPKQFNILSSSDKKFVKKIYSLMIFPKITFKENILIIKNLNEDLVQDQSLRKREIHIQLKTQKRVKKIVSIRYYIPNYLEFDFETNYKDTIELSNFETKDNYQKKREYKIGYYIEVERKTFFLYSGCGSDLESWPVELMDERSELIVRTIFYELLNRKMNKKFPTKVQNFVKKVRKVVNLPYHAYIENLIILKEDEKIKNYYNEFESAFGIQLNSKNEIIGILFTKIDQNTIQKIKILRKKIFKADRININYKSDREEIVQKLHNSNRFFEFEKGYYFF